MLNQNTTSVRHFYSKKWVACVEGRVLATPELKLKTFDSQEAADSCSSKYSAGDSQGLVAGDNYMLSQHV